MKVLKSAVLLDQLGNRATRFVRGETPNSHGELLRKSDEFTAKVKIKIASIEFTLDEARNVLRGRIGLVVAAMFSLLMIDQADIKFVKNSRSSGYTNTVLNLESASVVVHKNKTRRS